MKYGLFQKFSRSIIVALVFNSAVYAAVNAANPELIIIGAGTAGLRAGEYLKSRGFNNFIILEGKGHIGGRTYTYHSKKDAWNGLGMDLGANWVHGAGPYNPLTYLVEKKIKIPYLPSDESSSRLYDVNGKLMPIPKKKEIHELYAKFVYYMRDRQGSPKANRSSVSDAAKEFIKKEHLNPEQVADLMYLVSEIIEQEYAADITDLSWTNYDADESFNGPEWLLTGGYGQLVHYLARDLKGHIILNQRVTSIDYSNKNQVTVTTSDGKVYHAKTVISTLPTGVLQKGVVKFTPGLPENKQVALSRMNMGTLNKLWIKFPKVFWGKEQFMERVSRARLSHDEWIHKGRFLEFGNMDYSLHQPVLLLLVSGDFAKQLENKSDEQITAEIMSILKKIYGPNIPQPIAHKYTRWNKDTFSYGAYSSLRPGSRALGLDYKTMSMPIGRQLFFAGEGTHQYYPGTVHGAYLSGEREAKRFLHENIGTVRDINNSVSGFTYFHSGDVTTWGQGNYGFDLGATYDHFKDHRAFFVPLNFGYGITNNWEANLDLDTYHWNHPVDQSSAKGIGDLGLGTKYIFYNVANSMSDIAFDFQMRFPTGNFNNGISDGFVHYIPSVIGAHNMFFADWNAQIYAQLGVDATSRARSHIDSSLNEPRLDTLIFNAGGGLGNDYFILTAEYNLDNSKVWSNQGEAQAYATPGIKFLVSRFMSLGVGAPIGLTSSAANYSIIANLAYQFEPVRAR